MGVENLSLLFVSEYSVVVRESLMSVWFVSVFVVEAFSKFPEACWVDEEVDVFKCLFPESCLFSFNVGVNFRVEFLYSCNSVR